MPSPIYFSEVSVANPVAGVISNITFSFSITNPLPREGVVKIQFPSSDYPDFDNETLVHATFQNPSYKNLSMNIQSDHVVHVVRVDGGDHVPKNSDLYITLSNVQNPRYSIVPDNFIIATLSPDGFLIDQNNTVPAAPIEESTLAMAMVTLSDTRAGFNSTSTKPFIVNVTITNPFPNDGSAIITLPSDYDISGASIVGHSMGDTVSIGVNIVGSSTHDHCY